MTPKKRKYHRSRKTGVRYCTLDFLGFPGYRVGEDGSVWTKQKKGRNIGDVWKRMHPVPNCKGYLRLTLCHPGCRKNCFVHCLVLLAFIGPCPEGMETRHLDGNPANNRLDNLCWGTDEDNKADREQHGTTAKGECNGSSKLLDEEALDIRQRYIPGNGFYNRGNIAELAREKGVSQTTALRAATGVTFTHLPLRGTGEQQSLFD